MATLQQLLPNLPLTDEVKAQIEDDFNYHPPTGDQPDRYAAINEAAMMFAATVLAFCPPSPDRSDAYRRIRVARMVANASIATKSGGGAPR